MLIFPKGGRLLDCLISETIVSNLVECGHWCLGRGCQSLNYGTNESNGLFKCELNNCTNTDHLMLVDRKCDYYEMVRQWPENERCSEPSFSMLFPRHSTDDYIAVDDPALQELSAITICAWAKFVRNTNGTIISYAVHGSTNEIDIWCYTNEVIFSMKNNWIRKTV